MMKRFIPVLLLFFFFAEAVAQIPMPVQTETPVGTPNPNLVVVCPIGVSAFAGTSNQTLFPSAQSNDVEFLCLGDSLEIDHLGGQTFGDPDPSSPPGISYIFYDCPPTVSGSDLATVENDPCHITNPDPSPFPFWAAQSPTTPLDIDGNATFFNGGLLQNFFNNGDPVEIWFAPVTFDDWAVAGFETDGMGGPDGPCINVNTNDAFRVVYLNEIQGTNINVAANGPCAGSFVAEGGLPEFDGSEYTNISISLASDPSVIADIQNTNITHGETVVFSISQPGLYNVVIEDGKSCEASFTIDMSGCPDLTTTAGDEFATPGSTVCVPITATDGFVDLASFQYIIGYDPAVLTFQTINNVALPDDLLFSSPLPGEINLTWFYNLFPASQTFPAGTVLYEVCFTAIGAVGTSSPITFFGDDLTVIEIGMTNGVDIFAIGYEFNEGSVTITNSSITMDFTACSTTDILNNGSFTFTVTGGNAPYNFGWVQVGNPGNNGMGTIANNGDTESVIDLPPGTYDVAVTDATGTIQTGTITIPNTDPLFAQLNPTNPQCPGGMDGSMSLVFSGGIAPYDIVWSVPGNDGMTELNGLGQGTYSATVTDNLGCSTVVSQGIGNIDITLDTILLQHITCDSGPGSGAITVLASGGTPPFTYAWDNGATGPAISNLIAGLYNVIVTDGNGCVHGQPIAVSEPILPVITGFDSVSVICPNDQSGELTVIAQPGTSPIINYEWSNGQNDQTISGLNAGTYFVTVTDVDGCSTQDSVTLFAPPPMVIDYVVTEPMCPEDPDGQINLNITGGAEPYNILWENGSTDFVLPALTCDSFYNVTISDANFCETIEESIEVGCPSAIAVTFTGIEGVSCNGGVPCDGLATAIASGGTAQTGLYNFNWSSGEVFNNVSESMAQQLCQGVQTVEVNDGDCSVTVQVEDLLNMIDSIPSPPELAFDIANTSSIPVSCFGDSDGSATVQATGGTPSYTYEWTNPVAAIGPTIDNVPTGTYNVIATDANGCTKLLPVIVGEPDPLVAAIDLDNTFNASCAGLEDGQIVVTWTGGNIGGATYTWDPNVNNSSTATGLTVGTYSVTVTDSKGCSDEVQHTVLEPAPVEALIPPPVEPLCFGDQTVVTVDTAWGGIGEPYFFSVDFGPKQFETAAIPILAGDHVIRVFDSNDCFTEYNISVGQPLPVVVSLGPDTTIQLGDSVKLDPAIGSVFPIDTLLWMPMNFLRCPIGDTLCREPVASPLETIQYEITVIDVNGCVGTDEIIVDIDKNRNVYIPNAFSPNGDGINDVMKIYTGPGVAQVSYFHIYDRWGEQLYSDLNFLPADSYLEGWDGRFNGKDMNTGVYVYLAEVIFVDGTVLLYRGDVTLIR